MTNHACPNCGYCPHCGRSGPRPITYPQPWVYPQYPPIWYNNQTVPPGQTYVVS